MIPAAKFDKLLQVDPARPNCRLKTIKKSAIFPRH